MEGCSKTCEMLHHFLQFDGLNSRYYLECMHARGNAKGNCPSKSLRVKKNMQNTCQCILKQTGGHSPEQEGFEILHTNDMKGSATKLPK